MSDKDFEVIEPPSTEVEFNGRKVTIGPLKVGKLPAFARAVKPIAGAFESWNSITPGVILDLIAEHGENVIEAVSIASGVPQDELAEADTVALVSLITPIIKANADFFRLRLLLGAAMKQAVEPTGTQTPSGDGPTR